MLRSNARSTLSPRALRCSQRCLHASSARASAEKVLNRYSRTITSPKDQGASQVSGAFCENSRIMFHLFKAMLLATEGVNSSPDLGKPMVGVASVW